MTVIQIGGALGGIGLFLLGMRLMTDGLKVAAGAMLRELLARWTRTRFRGLLSGALITAIVQSSSAVTVATIGFVNAGVLTLGQAMWVIFGSNVGTTMTGWIVAIVGFDIRIEAFALPLLGAGMFLNLTGASTRRGALGEAIAGFGVFFLGIATLKATFASIGASFDMAGLVGDGVANDVLFVLVGILLTTLMQSSSAVIAIALTAAAGGIVDIESGAALVIGANVGTTSTAMLAALGATPNARRAAVSHVAFNALTAAAALLLLPLMLLIVRNVEDVLASGANPATTLALFHTAFKLLGVLIMWPISDRLERWLSARFVTAEENDSRPRYLDSNSLEVPSLAVDSVLRELCRVAGISLGIARAAFVDPTAPVERLARRGEIVRRLNDAVIVYIQRLNAAGKSGPVADAMAHPIRALWHFGEIADQGLSAARLRPRIASLPESSRNQIANYATLVAGRFDAAERAFADPAEQAPADDSSEQVYQRAKTAVLVATSNGEIGASEAGNALEFLNAMKTAVRHLDRAGKRMAAMAHAVRADEPKSDDRKSASP